MFSGDRKILILSAFLGLIFLGASFGAGYYFGLKKEYISAGILNVTNKEPTVAIGQEVDFSPFWKAWGVLSDRYVSKKKTPTDQEKIWGAISGLAQSTGDPYTVFLPPAETKTFQETISGEFGGVGMEIGMRDHLITVISPLKDTPAYNAGIKAGDRILKINATSTANMGVDEAVNLIRGKRGTEVSLTISREGLDQPLELKIIRDIIKIPTIDTELRKDGIFLIKLYSFSANSPELFRVALRQFVESGSDKLILDLRNNPGGYLEAAVDMASWFLPAGKVVVKEDAGEEKENKDFRSRGYNIFTDKLKMIILVNKGSASASEILAGALSEHGIAKLVGERTFGKGSVQELVPITDETSLKVTIARWLTPNGVSISEEGITPSVDVYQSNEDTNKGKDTVLEKAASILLSQLSQ